MNNCHCSFPCVSNNQTVFLCHWWRAWALRSLPLYYGIYGEWWWVNIWQ